MQFRGNASAKVKGSACVLVEVGVLSRGPESSTTRKKNQEDPLRVFSADLTPDMTSIVIPASFMRPGFDYKFEVLAIEESGNQTLSESAFSTAD